MAYFLNKGLAASQQEFIVETVADIAKLPTSTATGNATAAFDGSTGMVGIGSKALCVATGDLYILTPDNSWTKVGA